MSIKLQFRVEIKTIIPMFRNPPAEKGKIQAVLASKDWTESNERAAKAPITPTPAVQS